LQTGSGTILVINIYNDGDQQQAVRREVHEMRNLACTGTMAAPAQHQIWWGNFNLNHLLWDEGWNNHLFMRQNLEKSQLLIDMLAEFALQMALPKDLPTLHTLSSGNFYAFIHDWHNNGIVVMSALSHAPGWAMLKPAVANFTCN